MNPMPQLFTDLPNLFAILNELQHYSNQIVIPVDTISAECSISLPKGANYPIVTLITAALDLILGALPSLSSSFMIMMMKKHRSEKIKWINNIILTKPYCRLFFYIIGSLFYTSKLKLIQKTPKHEKDTLTIFALEFLATLQESDSPLIGMFNQLY